MTARLTEMKALFPNRQVLFDRSHLEAIAARLFRQTADYMGISNTGRNRRRIYASIESLLQDLDSLHPDTFQPMIQHRHVKRELAELLQLCKEIRCSTVEKCADESLSRRVAKIAAQSNRLSKRIDSPERPRRTDWSMPIVTKANEIHSRKPTLTTTAIAKIIANDVTLNPPRSYKHKHEETIRKLLNQRAIKKTRVV